MNTRYLAFALALLAGCESSPRPKDATPAAPQQTASAVVLDQDELITTAEKLRDREFTKRPVIEANSTFESTPLPGCASSCEEERRLLTQILFAGKAPVVPARIANWDATSNTVTYDAKVADAAAVRAAVLAELVRGLDGVATPKSSSWDAYLASAALRQGAGVFVAALDQAQKRQPTVDATGLSTRPEAILQLQFGSARFADSFATREGYAFTAALLRSGGWSAVELSHVEQPSRTLEVVRPDRYLAGDTPGQWTLTAPDGIEVAGFKTAAAGRVGPALFVEWLSLHVPAAVARAAYVGFESDSFEVYRDTKGAWVFQWASLWNTPTTAQQVVEALDAGLAQRSDGAKFVVLRKGATVGVIGTSGAPVDLTAAGTQLVDALPTFRPPRPRGVAFHPTPIDALNARPQVTSIAAAIWTDEATGVVVDLASLPTTWNALPTTEPNLPWFAKHDTGAVLQFLVQPIGLFDPAFESDDYAALVNQRFTQTMTLTTPTRVVRSDQPIPGSLVIEAEGKIKDRPLDPPVKLRAWHLRTGDFTTTMSLQASPDAFDDRLAELAPLFASVTADRAVAVPHSKGVIEFSVEE